MLLEAIDEIRDKDAGFFDKDYFGSKENFRNSFVPDVDLPQWVDIYEGIRKPSWHILRNVHFIDTKREKDMGVGEEFELDEIPFGVCVNTKGLTHDGDIDIFQFKYDYATLAELFNEEVDK